MAACCLLPASCRFKAACCLLSVAYCFDAVDAAYADCCGAAYCGEDAAVDDACCGCLTLRYLPIASIRNNRVVNSKIMNIVTT
jgi:hypothetical protein